MFVTTHRPHRYLDARHARESSRLSATANSSQRSWVSAGSTRRCGLSVHRSRVGCRDGTALGQRAQPTSAAGNRLPSVTTSYAGTRAADRYDCMAIYRTLQLKSVPLVVGLLLQ